MAIVLAVKPYGLLEARGGAPTAPAASIALWSNRRDAAA
jgi:hypothetical protein